MAITGYEIIVIQGDKITADLLVWRRYRRRCDGILEALLDANPHLASIHRSTPFLPIGTQVRIPIDPDVLKGVPKPIEITDVWTNRAGYTL